MWVLVLTQLATMLSIYSDELGSRASLIARELVKAIALNAVGVAMGLVAERNRRKNFNGALLYHEEVVLMTAVRNDVQRLLLNTLPEPIVREIASGHVEVAHRYDNVTVLQVDMVGFTPLSATHPPSDVLGILSDLFGTFDELSEQYGVHKVKTIGDAYVAVAGAFPVAGVEMITDTPSASAERTVNLALAIQQAVQDKALLGGIKIGARVGVHSGSVMGGIIGTVRFHFDMWGNGVIGAMRMEEQGASGRVHVSNTTADLLGKKFPLEAAHVMEDSFAKEYKIERSFFVDGSSVDVSKSAVYGGVDAEAEEDLTELLGESAIAIEQSLALETDDGAAKGRKGLSLPSMSFRFLKSTHTDKSSEDRLTDRSHRTSSTDARNIGTSPNGPGGANGHCASRQGSIRSDSTPRVGGKRSTSLQASSQSEDGSKPAVHPWHIAADEGVDGLKGEHLDQTAGTRLSAKGSRSTSRGGLKEACSPQQASAGTQSQYLFVGKRPATSSPWAKDKVQASKADDNGWVWAIAHRERRQDPG